MSQANKMRAKATKATAAQNMIRRAEQMLDGAETVRQTDRVAKLRFPTPSPCGKTPITGTGLSKSYGSLEVFTGVDLAIDRRSGDAVWTEGRIEETWNDDNGHSHVRAALVGPGLTIPFANGRLLTGEYQQVVLIDFDTGPRPRLFNHRPHLHPSLGVVLAVQPGDRHEVGELPEEDDQEQGGRAQVERRAGGEEVPPDGLVHLDRDRLDLERVRDGETGRPSSHHTHTRADRGSHGQFSGIDEHVVVPTERDPASGCVKARR
jgi:hypothetical protein